MCDELETVMQERTNVQLSNKMGCYIKHLFFTVTYYILANKCVGGSYTLLLLETLFTGSAGGMELLVYWPSSDALSATICATNT